MFRPSGAVIGRPPFSFLPPARLTVKDPICPDYQTNPTQNRFAPYPGWLDVRLEFSEDGRPLLESLLYFSSSFVLFPRPPPTNPFFPLPARVQCNLFSSLFSHEKLFRPIPHHGFRIFSPEISRFLFLREALSLLLACLVPLCSYYQTHAIFDDLIVPAQEFLCRPTPFNLATESPPSPPRAVALILFFSTNTSPFLPPF